MKHNTEQLGDCGGGLVQALKNTGRALAAADAHRHQAIARPAALQLVQQLHR